MEKANGVTRISTGLTEAVQNSQLTIYSVIRAHSAFSNHHVLRLHSVKITLHKRFITPSPNTLQCHSATSNVDQVVQCAGIEDRCFTLGISGLGLVQGCASQSACDNVQMIADYFGFTTISNISCCQGSFCNNVTNNVNSYNIFQRQCAVPESCNVSVSLNYGYGSTAWISQCCSSDLCNAENVSVASDPNGLVCCAGLNGLCQRLVMCTGIQDHCFISDTGLSAYSGCASQSVCDNPVTAAASLQISLSQQTHCCQGNVCNKPNVTLSCYVCQSSPSWDVCENTTTSCDSENSACGVFVNVNSSGLGVTNSETERSCVTLDRCNTTESTNYGLASSIWTSHCCDTDLCNTETVVSNTSGVINGLLCCATTDGTCQNAVQCTGVEDNCFTSDDGQNVYRGCTSQSVCNDPPHSLTARSWPFMSNSRCCQGNLCNRPDTLTCNNCYATSWTTCESHAEVCPQGDMYCVSSAYSYVTLDTSAGPNGLVCCSGEDGSCQSVVQCIGFQDKCFTSGSTRGCISNSSCSSPSMRCCPGSFCNDPRFDLMCYNCISNSTLEICDGNVVPCSSQNSACASMVESSTAGWTFQQFCAPEQSCNVSLSINYGAGSQTRISRCCLSDLCNDQAVNVSSDANGLVCCAGTDGTCQQTINCTGVEDHCFTSNDVWTTFMGCSSKDACDLSANSWAILPGFLSPQISCCQGDLCNQPAPRLSCNNCFSSNSWETCYNGITTCGSDQTTCASIFSAQTSDVATFNTFVRHCSTPEKCNLTLSINSGLQTSTWVSQCCSTDVCNTENADMPGIPNGLVCCGGNDDFCQSTVNCLGVQDQCFTSDIGGIISRGCSSKSVCADPVNASAVLQMSLSPQMQCCEGHLCNNPNAFLIYNECYSRSCDECQNNVTLCSSQSSACGVLVGSYNMVWTNYTIFNAGCIPTQTCNWSLSIDYGHGSNSWSSWCCNSSLCNVEKANISSDPNGLVCCAGMDRTCQNSMNCTGIQDHCFISDNGQQVYAGCTSKGVCDSPLRASIFLNIPLSSHIDCCQGPLCNEPGECTE
ncbi:uncharacterized protein LOC120517407 [Polypterus senegalus]|uniref:uncharacterized protein LOC120517407 n=1 Tax=Polypterus senegalus TaxID=55291 RepID=UPI001963C16E|nr:uncharacterized protein LOC120517407 [Polypterus senegalus]